MLLTIKESGCSVIGVVLLLLEFVSFSSPVL